MEDNGKSQEMVKGNGERQMLEENGMRTKWWKVDKIGRQVTAEGNGIN